MVFTEITYVVSYVIRQCFFVFNENSVTFVLCHRVRSRPSLGRQVPQARFGTGYSENVISLHDWPIIGFTHRPANTYWSCLSFHYSISARINYVQMSRNL